MNYTLKNDNGEIIDSSADSQPLAYIHGIGFLIPGLEDELEGKQKGDKLSVKVAPENGYGEHQEELVFRAPRSEFPEGEIIPGMEVELDMGEETAVALITEVTEDQVTLDLNHPLAGQHLHFDVEVISVRDASDDELDHGHIHGPGGVEH